MRRTLAGLLGIVLALTAVGLAELRQREREKGAYALLPGLKYVSVPPNVRNVGWKEDRTPPPRRPGVGRVLAVGDSVTAGVGVKVEEAWPGQIQAALGAEVVEVFNFGENGWDASQVAALLETRIGAWAPDLVIWGTYANDVFPTRVLLSSTSGDAVYVDSEVPAGARIVPARLESLLLAHSALFRHVQAVGYTRWVARDDEAPVGWYGAQVARIRGWSARSGVPVVALAIPSHVTTGVCTDPFCEVARTWYELLRAGLADGGLPWTDGLEAWEGRGPFMGARGPDPDHPNAEGHRMLADLVAPEVRARLGAAAP